MLGMIMIIYNFRIDYYKRQAFCLIDVFKFLLEIIILIKIIWLKNHIMQVIRKSNNNCQICMKKKYI